MNRLYRPLAVSLLGLTLALPVVASDAARFPGDIEGTSGNDRLVSSDRAKRLLGYAGDDVLIGNGGRDIGIGGSGSDVLRMGAGSDTLNGGVGRNRLYGGPGSDFFLASRGGFELQVGGPGNDSLHLAAKGRVVGGPGRDQAFGGPGVQRIRMGDGPDSVTLLADNRPDFVDCGAGYDSLHYIGEPPTNDVVKSCESRSYQER